MMMFLQALIDHMLYIVLSGPETNVLTSQIRLPTGDKGQDCHSKGSKARLRQGWLVFFRIAKH